MKHPRKYFSIVNLNSLCVFSIFFFLCLLVACSPKTQKSDQPKILNLSFGDDVKSADPAQANDVVSAELNGHIFEGLLEFSYLGDLGEVEPALAETVPEFKQDTRELKFRIRKGVKFQDDPAFPEGKGREVTAADFVYSFKRVGDCREQSANSWMFDGMIEGFKQWREACENAPAEKRSEAFESPVSGLKALDSHTLMIKLSEPNPNALSILAMTHASVMAREVVEKYGPEIVTHPVGTGPFRLKEWLKGTRITVEKNPTYHGDTYPNAGNNEARQNGLLLAAGKKLPLVDGIHWHIVKEEAPHWLKLMAGQIDEGGIPKDNFAEAIGPDGNLSSALASKGFKLHKALSMTSWWIEFNMKDAVLGKNAKLRQALALAFDRSRALNLLYNGRGIIADGPFTPTLEGGSKLKPFPWTYNLEAAKAKLAEAGFPDGKGLPELTFDLRGPGTTPRQLGELMQENFSKIGVKLKILANSFPEALEKAKTSRFQIMLGGWAGDYPDPENYLAQFYTGNLAPGPNSANFQNPEYDKLYLELKTQPRGPEREKKIIRMVEILSAEVPAIFFFHSMDFRLSSPRLLNFKPHPLLYGIGKFLDLDPSKTPKSGG